MKELKISSPVKLNNIDKLKSEAYDKIMNDKIVRAFIKEKEIPLSFVNDNLGLFLRMVEENEPCATCKSFQDCKKVNLQKGYLTFVDADETIYYEKCKYYKQFLEIANLYQYKDFPDEKIFLNYRQSDLVDQPTRTMYVMILKSILENHSLYISSKENMDLLTDLLISGVNSSIKNKKVIYINSTNLKDKADRYNKYEQDKFFKLKDDVFNADILVIDSLGSEGNSEFYKYSFLMDLLTYRNAHHSTTFISSYFDIDQLQEVYSGYNLMNKTKLLIEKIKEYFEIIKFETILRR